MATATESGVDHRKAAMEKEEQREVDMDYALSKSRLHPILENGSMSVCVIGVDGRLPPDGDDDDDDGDGGGGGGGGGGEEKEVSKIPRRIEQQTDPPPPPPVAPKGIWVRFFLAQVPQDDTNLTTTTLGVEKEEYAACDGEHEYSDQHGFWSILAPFQEKRLDLNCIGFVSVGPTLYCLAGSYSRRISDQVHVLTLDNHNTTKLNYPWTLGPCMIRPRSFPLTLVVQGKIYAFGGVSPHDEAWAEVLDTTNPHPAWKALPSPPMPLISRGLFALLVDDADNIFFGIEENEKENNNKKKKEEHDDNCGDDEKTILLGSSYDRVFFTYNIRESTWRTIPWSIPVEYYASDPVAVGHTLFWVGAYFCGYNLRRRLLYRCVVRGLNNLLQKFLLDMWNQEDTSHTPTLHHLGGYDFCLTWFGSLGVWPYNFIRLHTTRIRVRFYEDGGGLDAFAVSSHSYLLPRGFRFRCSLLLDGFSCGQETTQEEGFVYEDMICLYNPSAR